MSSVTSRYLNAMVYHYFNSFSFIIIILFEDCLLNSEDNKYNENWVLCLITEYKI